MYLKLPGEELQKPLAFEIKRGPDAGLFMNAGDKSRIVPRDKPEFMLLTLLCIYRSFVAAK